MESKLELLEEVYLETSSKLKWNPANCHHYSTKHGVCYGAPIFLGNKDVWGREGLFEELNRRLIEGGFKPLTWEDFKKLIREITRPGVVWASWFSSVRTRQVEPHDLTIMIPLREALKYPKSIYSVPGIYP
jgi:ABC-type glycerol-3-phosphate transport system substrate-binding protein